MVAGPSSDDHETAIFVKRLIAWRGARVFLLNGLEEPGDDVLGEFFTVFIASRVPSL